MRKMKRMFYMSFAFVMIMSLPAQTIVASTDSFSNLHAVMISSGGSLVTAEALLSSHNENLSRVELTGKVYRENTLVYQETITSNTEAEYRSNHNKSYNYTLVASGRTKYQDGTYSSYKYSYAYWSASSS